MQDTDPAPEQTLAERAALRLRAGILSGSLQPGERLGVVEIARQFGVGTTPVREGLSRLVSQGLVVAIGRRGFRVSEISRADLADLTRLRSLVEVEGLRLAMERGDDAWEAGILSALHRLKALVRRAGMEALEGTPDYDVLHKAFHMALLSACGSPRLMESASALYDQAYRYRRLMLRRLTDPDHFVAVHDTLAQAAIARDHAFAAPLLVRHLETTLCYVYPDEGG